MTGAGIATLIYSKADSTLYYDANGKGEGYTIVATVDPGVVVTKDEPPRDTSLEALARLKGVVRPEGTPASPQGPCPSSPRRHGET